MTKIQSIHFAGPLEWLQAEAADGEQPKLAKISFAAYTGGAMRFAWSQYPVIVDLTGMTGTETSKPVLKDHYDGCIVGHTTGLKNNGKTLTGSAIMSGVGEAAQEILATGKNGFPWQVSIGADMSETRFLPEKTKDKVNGQAIVGPALIVTKSHLREISIVAMGADDKSAAQIAAQARKDQAMTVESEVEKSAPATVAAAAQPIPNQSDPIAEMRAAAAEEAKRINEVQAKAKGHADLAAKAIADGWTAEKTELEVLRAERSKGPAIHVPAGHQPMSAKVLEAAFVAPFAGQLRSVDIDKTYGDQNLQAAHDRFPRGLGLHDLLLEAAWANGYHGRTVKGDLEGVLKAAFSTRDISGILSNVANKFLLEGFYGVEQAWQEVSAISSVTDFKTITSYRLTASSEYQKVAPGGEIPHGTLGEESYTNKADTYGLRLAVTRTDLINDDQNALTKIPKMLGRGSALKLNKIFWAEFLNDSTFFPTNGSKGNYIEGSTTNLSSAGMALALNKFRRQTDPEGSPLGLEPRVLLVPPELEGPALELMQSMTVNSGGAASAAQIPNANIYAGRYRVAVSSYLTQAKRWYLIADPNDLALIETVFLNGQTTPTIEQTDADFSTLGIQMRGYHDFGVAKQDYRAGVKSKGEA